jgi:hypothetical protein
MPEPGGRLVLMWGGHGVSSPDGLRLLARDSGSYVSDGLGAGSDVAAPGAESGASQLLLIVDTCYSGKAVAAGELAAQIMQLSPQEREHRWVGVLTSCLPDLCDAILKTRDGTAHSPDFQSRGSAWWMFPNPRYDGSSNLTVLGQPGRDSVGSG